MNIVMDSDRKRCAQQAIITALDMMNDCYDWIVDIDLEKFFDTVNHDKLMTLIGKAIKDGDVISIINKFLVSGSMVDDEYQESVSGGAMNVAVTEERVTRFGLVSMLDYYTERYVTCLD